MATMAMHISASRARRASGREVMPIRWAFQPRCRCDSARVENAGLHAHQGPAAVEGCPEADRHPRQRLAHAGAVGFGEGHVPRRALPEEAPLRPRVRVDQLVAEHEVPGRQSSARDRRRSPRGSAPRQALQSQMLAREGTSPAGGGDRAVPGQESRPLAASSTSVILSEGSPKGSGRPSPPAPAPPSGCRAAAADHRQTRLLLLHARIVARIPAGGNARSASAHAAPLRLNFHPAMAIFNAL